MLFNLNSDSSSEKVKPASQDELSYASSAAAAMLYQSPRGGQQLLWVIVLFIVAMLAWAATSDIDEFTRGDGRVIPSSSVQLVQNLEGGIVAEVFVREGQRVSVEEPLLRLDDVRFTASLRETKVTQSQLEIKAARLKAEVHGRPFPESVLLASLPKDEVAIEKDLYQVRQNELRDSQQVVEQQMVQKQQELSEMRAKRQQVQRSYRLLKDELDLTKPLVKQGAVSQVELLRLQRQVNDIAGELESVRLSLPRAEAALLELEQKRASVESAFRSESQAEFTMVQSELSRLRESSQAIEDQVNRTLVKSPVAGTIKQLFVKTLGGVVQPGMDLLAIVPTEDNLLVETRIRPADIAFMHPGQRAMVKFTAYDFSIHGGLPGKVIRISPDTIVNEEGQSFYLVQIETQGVFRGRSGNSLPIIPGMTVNVDVLTGQKTVLDYLLKPILKTKQLALKER